MNSFEEAVTDRLVEAKKDIEGVVCTMRDLANDLEWESVEGALRTTIPKIWQTADALRKVCDVLERCDLRPKA